MVSITAISSISLIILIGYVSCINNQKPTTCPLRGKCKKFKQVKLTEEEKKYIVDYHNEKRNHVALGKQKGQPGASNMQVITWDKELVHTAQCRANNCQSVSDEYDTQKYQVGQNVISWYIMKEVVNRTEIFKDILDYLYDEVNIMSSDNVDCFDFDFDYGHYSQIVWANTNRIGCGVSLSDNKDDKDIGDLAPVKIILVCNYGPAGNYKGRIYKRGKPCSQCKTKCSKKYRGLCES